MSILNLSEYYTDSNKPKSANGEEIIPMPDRRTQQQREPLLKGLDSKYVNDSEMDMAANRMGTSTTLASAPKIEGDSFGSKLAGSASANVGQIADFASTAIQLNSNVARSDKEANARTSQLALKGAAAGASVGTVFGPLGTAIGAVGGALVGGTIGALKKVPDRKKRLANDNENYNNRMFAMTAQTNQMAENASIQEELQNQQNLAKAQMGLLNLKY